MKKVLIVGNGWNQTVTFESAKAILMANDDLIVYVDYPRVLVDEAPCIVSGMDQVGAPQNIIARDAKDELIEILPDGTVRPIN